MTLVQENMRKMMAKANAGQAGGMDAGFGGAPGGGAPGGMLF